MSAKIETVTRKQAEAVLKALVKAFPAYTNEFVDGDLKRFEPMAPDSPYMPQIVEDYDGYPYVIIWESGSPYDWVYLFPHGGISEEFGAKVPETTLPAGVWTEAVNNCVIAILPT